MTLTVARTADFLRISSLPRRAWVAAELDRLAGDLTEILRTPTGTMSLRPVQALALHDAGIERGLFGSIGVGEGKTVISLLLPVVLQAERPLLLVPGGLIEKTQRDRAALSAHWRVPTHLRLLSYDLLSRVQAKEALNDYKPDLIICDEVHRLKNRRAAVTRVVARYMHASPLTTFCGMSGTVMSHSLKDFAHILNWALKLSSPIPHATEEIEEWAEVLDQTPNMFAPTREPGALLDLCSAEERRSHPPVVAARHGFRRRLTETPGVVSTLGDGEHIGASIRLTGIMHAVADATESAFSKLRTEWRTPDEWELDTAIDVWRHAQELALGLYYVWNPRPPIDWLTARSNWGRFVRETIANSRTFDSELHVANGVDAGRLPAGAATLDAWRTIRSAFEPNVEARWCDDSALSTCAHWLRKPGLLWTEHNLFAERLAEVTGLPYFGAGGFSDAGAYIEDCKPGVSVIASVDANREGKNLQRLWSRNLVVCPPASAAIWEQMIARTHRPGQDADEVEFDVLLGCRENYDACTHALAGAQVIADVTGKRQKLLLADVTLPLENEIDAKREPRWQR